MISNRYEFMFAIQLVTWCEKKQFAKHPFYKYILP